MNTLVINSKPVFCWLTMGFVCKTNQMATYFKAPVSLKQYLQFFALATIILCWNPYTFYATYFDWSIEKIF